MSHLNSGKIKLFQLSDFITSANKRIGKDFRDQKVYSVTNSNGFVLSEEQFKKKVFSVDQSNYKIVKNNYFAYNPSRINVGSIALFEGAEGIVSPLYEVFTVNDNLNSKYLLRYLKSETGTQYIKHFSVGGVRNSLKLDGLGKIPIPMPINDKGEIDINEQHRIINIIDSVNLLRTKKLEVKNKINSILPAIFIEMFGDPNANPKKWEILEFSKICEFSKKQILPSTLDEEINFIGLENIESDSGKVVNFSKTYSKKIKSTKSYFETGDILYGKLRPYLNKVVQAKFNGVCSTDILVIKAKQGISTSDYLEFFLRRKYIAELAKQNSKGANLPRVSADFLKKLNVPLPPIKLQLEFSKKVEKFRLLENSQEKSEKKIEDVFYSTIQSVFSKIV